MKTENIFTVEKESEDTIEAEDHQRNAHEIIHEAIHELKHYLPAQAPLKDFIHHNTLHAFQNLKFSTALDHASQMFGYRVSLPLNDYRTYYDQKRISDDVLDRIIIKNKGKDNLRAWKQKMLSSEYRNRPAPRIGALRSCWKKHCHIDLDTLVHPTLFRILCSYLDQGISMWNFPVWNKGFLGSIREIERNSFTSFFRTPRARNLLLDEKVELKFLLNTVVGSEKLYKQYLFDQQFAHQGWSGIVSVIEDFPETLLDRKNISLAEVIIFELLLEIDTLQYHFGDKWLPLSTAIKEKPTDLFADLIITERREVLNLWQEAYEWSYYDEVLAGLVKSKQLQTDQTTPSFQAMFCIDDRECSFRRHLEKADSECETFGTPGFFSVEFFFKPEHGKFYTKLCPAPVTPKYLIKELDTKSKRTTDPHFTKNTHTLFRGWLISQTLGFVSAVKLFHNIFRPSATPATASSFAHMDQVGTLTIENQGPEHRENDLQIGFTIAEMATRVESLLRSIGLVKDFASIVYAIGHGASSVNNPHYAAYDCGACSGRPGSVNARVVCTMANNPQVRTILETKGIHIPAQTQFLGGLHDTTRDEVAFYDVASLSVENQEKHRKNVAAFNSALKVNAKERSRRFDMVNTKAEPEKIHEEMKRRSVSLFEPRPELNHATNTLCIIGRRKMTKKLFMDRRGFMNSYDYEVDPDGKYLLNILNAAAPVCGGINLEYFFSRVDNQKLGAGTKLPHNVMGLFGVANGIEGDLRPGLPSQMIEVHDPVRLLMVVEHFPEVVLNTMRKNPATYEWFINEWVQLVAVHPETNSLFVFTAGEFVPYETLTKNVKVIDDFDALIESSNDNLPICIMK
jgi:uncharacterized protein